MAGVVKPIYLFEVVAVERSVASCRYVDLSAVCTVVSLYVVFETMEK
mgnify:CR=1 FL=1